MAPRWGCGGGQLKRASPPVSSWAARALFCQQSSGCSRRPILEDVDTHGPTAEPLWQILLRSPTAAPSSPGYRSCSSQVSQAAQQPREASTAAPKKAGVPRGTTAPTAPAPSGVPLQLSCARTPPGGHGCTRSPKAPASKALEGVSASLLTRWLEGNHAHSPPAGDVLCVQPDPACLACPLLPGILDPRGIKRGSLAEPGASAVRTREEPQLGSSGVQHPLGGSSGCRSLRACPQLSSPSSSEHQGEAH